MLKAVRSLAPRATASARAAASSRAGSAPQQFGGEGSVKVTQSAKKLSSGKSKSLPSLRQQQAQFSTVQKSSFEVINAQDTEHFQKIALDIKGPVVVDFYAGWCGPCKILTPRLEKVMEKHGKGTPLIKVDIENEDMEDMVTIYRVSAVPTVIGLKDGQTVEKFMGVQDEDQLEAFLAKLTA